MTIDPIKELALALAEQSPDDDALRDWLTDRAEFIADALAAAGLHMCSEGEAVLFGRVVMPDQSSDAEVRRWNKAIDRILNSGLLFPYMADFWSYVDGEIEWDQFRDRMSP